MKFSPLNVDFGSLTPDPLGSIRSTPQKWLFSVIGLSSVKTIADRHRHAAYHNKHWWCAF